MTNSLELKTVQDQRNHWMREAKRLRLQSIANLFIGAAIGGLVTWWVMT